MLTYLGIFVVNCRTGGSSSSFEPELSNTKRYFDFKVLRTFLWYRYGVGIGTRRSGAAVSVFNVVAFPLRLDESLSSGQRDTERDLEDIV